MFAFTSYLNSLYAHVTSVTSVAVSTAWRASAMAQMRYRRCERSAAQRPPQCSAQENIRNIKYAMAIMLADCGITKSERMLLKIHMAESVQELWLLRVDIFHRISSVHGEVTAKTRINSMISMFRGRLGSQRVSPI